MITCEAGAPSPCGLGSLYSFHTLIFLKSPKVPDNKMICIPAVAVIIENGQGEILLLLRDNDPGIAYPNCWTLVGGKVEEGETPKTAAHREMLEEIGVDIDVTFWKKYDRKHPYAIVEQHIYLGKIDLPRELLTLGEGQDFHFFSSSEIKNLKIGFEFDSLLHEYFLGQKAK